MASESEASCEDDSNFAVICAFLEKFGPQIGVTNVDFLELQSMLENTVEVPKDLLDLNLKLLRRIRKSLHTDRWEKALVKVCHTFSSQDAWEVERFGYKKAKLSSKVRILKELLEMQFDHNSKFKTEVNKLGSKELRSQPLGRDKFGHAYWFQSDDNYQIRVFKEDLDDDKWTLVARDREGLVSLISKLSDGDIKISSDSAGNEDSNSLSEKPLIDTGQQDSEDSNLGKKNAEDKEKGEDEAKEKPRPILRIKTLSELMPSPKRPREEMEEEKIFQKYKIKNLEVVVSDISKEEPVVGEAIEEPVIKIQGEGSGAENDSPIVGEAIEEVVMYFYGHGSGKDCQTGNETDETDKNSSNPTSITDNIKTVPVPEKSAVNSESKTDDSKLSKTSNSEDSPKKPMFFFGSNSSPFKSTLISPTIGFGNSKNDEDLSTEEPCQNEQQQNGDGVNNCVHTENNEDLKASEEGEEAVKGPSPETKENDAKSEPKENLNETDLKVVKPSDISGDKDDTDKLDNGEDKAPVSEPLCVKKFAYVCGKEDEENAVAEKDPTIEREETVKAMQEVDNKETQKVEINKDEPLLNKEEGNTEVSKRTERKNLDTKVAKDDQNIPINENNTDKDKASVKILQKDKPDSQQSEKGSNAKEEKEVKADALQPEVVYVSGRKTRGRKQSEVQVPVAEKRRRPIRKGSKGGAVAKKKEGESIPEGLKKENGEGKSKAKSEESSITNSPAQSLGDNSVISLTELTAGDSCDVVEVPQADPLAVSDAEVDAPKAAAPIGSTVRSFSLDFNDAATPAPIPIITPSPMRSVRKRGREVTSLKTQEPDNGPGKRMKLKGRRQVDTALRKSVEQRIEQLQGSSSDSKDSEEEKPVPKGKKGARFKKKAPPKKNAAASTRDAEVAVSEIPPKAVNKKKDSPKKNSRLLAGLDITEDHLFFDRPGLRQSRRIAQLKIKEQVEPQQHEKPNSDEKGKAKKKGKRDDKNGKPEKRKRNKHGKEEEDEEEDVSEPEVVLEKKKKKKKEKPMSQLFNEKRPWQSSSDDSDEVEEEEEEEEEIIDDDPPMEALKSDHEFSPESDIENDEESIQPMKRARTARKDSDAEEVDEFPCQKCGKNDHPEWILLCDKCDNGWHCSCLRPPLLVIPEGEWFCPPCQHALLLEQLQAKLIDYDKKLNKKEVEDRRKERLAYVGISLNNVLPGKDRLDHRKTKRRHSAEGSGSSSARSASEESGSESESDSDEPIYQLRQRRQAKTYKFNEYDEMMRSAIGEEMEKPEDTAGNLGRGKDIQTIVKGLEPEPKAPNDRGEEDDEVRPPISNLKKMLRKKHRKLNSLEVDSEEEDISDEDFKGTSSESEEEEESEGGSDDSEDYLGKKRRKNLPTRRSSRNRTRRFDRNFINDDSDEDEAPRRKKKKSIWDDSETEESEGSWSGRSRGSKKKKKKKKKKGRLDDSDLEPSIKKNRPRIKYGGLTSSEEEETGPGRRTRGKKTTYVETLGTDSEEETTHKKNPRRIESDEEDEDFVANDEEKDSEEKEEEDEQEEENDSERERREKRSLLVPKIYIKKPLGDKKPKPFEPQSKPETMTAEITDNKKVEDKSPVEKSDPKPEESKPVVTVIPDKPKVIENNSISIAEVNKNLTKVDLDEVEKVVVKKEESDHKQLTMMGAKLPEPKEKKPQLLTAFNIKRSVAATPEKVPAKRGRKPKVVHEPIVSTALIKNNDENDDLSEPPGISLPLFDDLASTSTNSKESESSSQGTPKKRRGRGPGKAKKSLEETLANLGNKTPLKTPPDKPAIEIAAPPQPFSQAQPTPSVITRMLQSKPGQATIYPVGSIRPKQFATMPDDDSDEPSPTSGRSRGSSPVSGSPIGGPPPPINQYIPGGPRGPPSMGGAYRPPNMPPHPGMNHFPRGAPPMRGPPPSHPYSHHPSHRPMDPSPSGGGPVNLSEPGPTVAPPGRASPVVRGPPVSRYPSISQTTPGPVIATPRPQLPPLPQQPYLPPPPGGAPPPPQSDSYYNSYPPPTEEALPPTAYQGSPYAEQYAGDDPPANPPSDNSNSKTYDEESGGEFAGLASYFSSQREDDLES